MIEFIQPSDNSPKWERELYDYFTERSNIDIDREHLYHYTSAPGLEGIVKNRAIWMGHARYMNDTSELYYFRELLTDNIRRRMISDKSRDPSEALETMQEACRQQDTNVFFTSLSESGDLLSQWRGYTGGKPGFSIGFPFKRLQTAAGHQNARLAKVCYDEDEAKRVADTLISSWITYFQTMRLGPAGALASELSKAVSSIAPLFKPPGFSEEAEWRIIKFLDLDDLEVRFRSTASTVIPYVHFTISDIVDKFDSRAAQECCNPAHADLMNLIHAPGQETSIETTQALFWRSFRSCPMVESSKLTFKFN